MAFTTNALFPYVIKQLIDSTAEFSGKVKTVWFWGLGVFALFLVHNLFLRISSFIGIRSLAHTKAEIYSFFTVNLTQEFNDHSGTIFQMIAIVGEGCEKLLNKHYWEATKLILSYLVFLTLLFSAHITLFGVLITWIILHLASDIFLNKWRKRYNILFQQATSRFIGVLENFYRERMMNPERHYNLLSDGIYTIKEALATRTQRQITDKNIEESIFVFHNIIHGFFLISALILVLVLWQDGELSPGDVAMSITILFGTQQILMSTSFLLSFLTEAYAQVEAGLHYLNTDQLKGLPEGYTPERGEI